MHRIVLLEAYKFLYVVQRMALERFFLKTLEPHDHLIKFIGSRFGTDTHTHTQKKPFQTTCNFMDLKRKLLMAISHDE